MISVDVIVSVSVSIEILLFVIIVTVHCYLSFMRMFPSCKKIRRTDIPNELPLIAGDNDDSDLGSPARVITRREELIYNLYVTREHTDSCLMDST